MVASERATRVVARDLLNIIVLYYESRQLTACYTKTMKQLMRNLVCRLLERRVRELRARHEFTVVAVAGSVGKTSTKMAIAHVLEAAGKRVRYQEGNYNARISVPLVFFGETMPSLMNVSAWIEVLRRMDRQIAQPFAYDVVVIELGTDGPGQMAEFAYIQPDITVVSAISPEHMANFADMDAVAHEEMAVAAYSRKLLVNVADVAPEYLANVDYVGYGVDEATEYRAVRVGDSGIVGQKVKITTASGAEFDITTNYSGRQGATIVLAAASVADMLGVATEVIAGAIAKLEPFAGRLQVLDGVNDSQIIDDTYNSSPLATRAALDVLYAADVPQKIAILGDMNELGETSADEHRTLGEYCRADKLDYVVTIGVQSREYLAPAAREAGCQVKSFTDPVRAGEFVRDVLQPGAIILAKGSQNGVFAEEAVKQLLRNPSDAGKLVRQSEEWMGKKRFN